MDTWDCLKCGHENEWESCFGDDETCKKCKIVHETDWDYLDYDSIAHWVVGIKDDK